jgi:hypothetical protein
MALANGTKLGPYEIQSAAGVGGMGEVEALARREPSGSRVPKSRVKRGIRC